MMMPFLTMIMLMSMITLTYMLVVFSCCHFLILFCFIAVDCVANVFTLLKEDLRDELSKELFIFYHGPLALLNYFKPTAKV